MKVGILHQYSLLSSGSGIYAARLAEGLVADGHTVHVFCRDLLDTGLDFVKTVVRHTADETANLQTFSLKGGGNPSPACTVHLLQGAVRPNAYPCTDAPHSPLFTELSDDQIESFINWQAAQVTAVVQEAGLEILHANHTVLMPAVAARVRAATGIPYVMTVHGSTIEYVVNRDPRYLSYAQEGLSQAERVIVLNWDVRGRTLAICPPARVIEVSVGVDTDLFRPVPAQTVKDTMITPTVIYVGKLSLEKGVHCLLAAAPVILTRAPRARLLVVGDGVARQSMEALVVALSRGDLAAARRTLHQAGDTSHEGQFISYVTRFWQTVNRAEYLACARSARLRERITFTGYLPLKEVALHVRQATLNVIPSLVKEAFPLVSVEALASGVLPVASAYGGLIPILDEIGRALGPIGHKARLRHGPDTLTADLSRRIPLLLSMFSRLEVQRRVARRCRQLAVERYDWSKVIQQIEGIYQEAV